MSALQTPKRFIAGAVCPRCGAMDRIMMYTTDEGQFRECVACDYSDSQSDAEPASEGVSKELETRVNSRSNADDHTVKQVVFFKSGPGDDEEP